MEAPPSTIWSTCSPHASAIADHRSGRTDLCAALRRRRCRLGSSDGTRRPLSDRRRRAGRLRTRASYFWRTGHVDRSACLAEFLRARATGHGHRSGAILVAFPSPRSRGRLRVNGVPDHHREGLGIRDPAAICAVRDRAETMGGPALGRATGHVSWPWRCDSSGSGHGLWHRQPRHHATLPGVTAHRLEHLDCTVLGPGTCTGHGMWVWHIGHCRSKTWDG